MARLIHVYKDQNLRFEEQQVIKLIIQAADALEYAHGEGNWTPHFDVKPSNFLITGEGILKLADFGVSANAVVMERFHGPQK